MKISVNLVDDDKAFSDMIENYLKIFFSEKNIDYTCKVFREGATFLTEYKSCDIVLLDISMPVMDGLQTAKELRKIDKNVALLFITSMSQYAIEGYTVDAIDYVLKPLSYYNFADKMNRVLNYVCKHRDKKIVLKTNKGMTVVYTNDIYYVEKNKNYIIYHTKNGDFTERGTMNEKKSQLDENCFSAIAKGCIVNMNHVQQLTMHSVTINGTVLPISRLLYQSFTNDFMKFISNE